MDESLSEFQETKKNCAGPKTTVKKNSKPRKAPKRPRGQKDIRTALRSKKNELESYSKDFDKVCKIAGIDVDPEQLQLAIALSKSLQETASTSNDPTGSQTVTTQDKIGKIRTTLQEYGFKVPEVKIAGNTRRIRKHRKNYKLIQTSEVEKKEIIANRYSQVLFQNITHSSLYYSDLDNTDIPLYYLASNVTYDILRIKDTFYLENLIEKSTSTGNLLRDWSKIPGRPESPKLFKPMSMNFSEIECSQDELEIILSGSLKSCKDIVSKKMKDWLNSNECKLVTEDNISIEHINKEEINKNNQEYTLTKDEEVKSTVEPILTVNKHRSCSPDMFDDDASDICAGSTNLTLREVHKTNTNSQVMDLTGPICEKSHSKLYPNKNVTNRKSNDMELTDCIPIQSEDRYAKAEPMSQLSQKTNVTKRRSNDLMELTECVAASSQPIQNNIDLTQSPDIIEENTLRDETNFNKCMNSKPSESNIDLTKSPENKDCKDDRNTPKEVEPDKDLDRMDLTQSSNTSDELPFISLTVSKNKSLDDTIIVDINDYAPTNRITNPQRQVGVHIDLTNNIQRDNDASMHSQSIFEEYNHDHSDGPEDPKASNSDIITNKENHDRIDLTQSSERSYSTIKYASSRESLDSLEEHNSNTLSQPEKSQHSSTQIMIKPVTVGLKASNSPIKNISNGKLTCTNGQYEENPIDDIDLTQKSDTTEELCLTPKNYSLSNSNNIEEINKDNDLPTGINSQRCSSLGKKDDVSIDYDNIIKDANDELVYSENINPESIIYENPDENVANFSKSNSFLSNCSQNSVFEISDKELDYSLHKSKLEIPGVNFAFGGISIMDELSNFGTSKKSMETDNNSIVNEEEVESFPAINVKNSNKSNEISPIKHRRITEIATPQKPCSSSNMVTVITPKNSEMIIKSNNVTPMIDYESMSTPDIHNELDKYGIKPFKRKRAIQLLTHIYNQTHPIVETADELASPPKRHKPNVDIPTYPKKLLSPRKLLTSPRKASKDTDNSNKNIPDTDKGKENNQNNKEGIGNNIRKGKGKGKKSLENPKKDVPAKADSGSIVNTKNRSKEIDNEASALKEIECSPDDWVFQKREKAKVHSCRVPLHIAFYNYVSARRDLREAILCYEPVEIDLIHKDLVGYGHRYDPKDLLKFLDKKCITVKTTDNDARNNKRS